MTISTSSHGHGYQALLSYLNGSNTRLISRGLEKEGLRVTPDFSITQSDHPDALGHPLTHSSITTDYSEALLELITSVQTTRQGLISELEATHKFVLNNIGDESLWAGSMPCRLDGNDSIRIAEYGDSNIGQLKHVYRKGLDVRYGRIMQSIAGLHFNFSLSDEFWNTLKDAEKSPATLQEFKSQKYFALTRNFRRYSWLLMYLFGASPALDQSFLEGCKHDLERFDEKGTLYRPFATSLRMSDLGYSNNAQSSLNICFNTLENFTNTLTNAIHTSYPRYEEIGLHDSEGYTQLNTNVLQIENEYYSSIRPKRTTLSGEKPTAALNERGVEYVEVRCLDLNPYLPLGIDETQIAFVDAFLLFCLLEDSPVLSAEACEELEGNFSSVTTDGRRPNLTLKRLDEEISLTSWATEILSRINDYAALLDNTENTTLHQESIALQQAKVDDASLCPSARILEDMRTEQQSWLELAGSLSNQHKHTLTAATDMAAIQHEFERLAAQSHDNAEQIKQGDTVSFDKFLSDYVS
jgi:glutamate--cysteine ligase